MIRLKVSSWARLALTAALLFATGSLPGPQQAQACYDLTVRDAAFEYPRSVHLLAVMARADDPAGKDVYSALEQWLSGPGKGLNLELRRVDPGSPDVIWTDYGIPSAPPLSPVVVLAGSGSLGQPNFLVDHWEPGPGAGDLEILKSSPVREEIKREVTHRLAVLIHVPGNDNSESDAGEVIESVVRTWAKREPLGVAVVRVDRSDERERLLLAFMGAKRTGPDWVGVVFGRGKLMPPLRGEEITEERLNGLLEPLLGDCSCLQSPAALGVDLPMEWDETLDSALVKLRSNDIQVSGVSGTWGILATTAWTLGGLVFLVGIATALIMRSRKRFSA
ncbi:MAG TPA: hypothetical protein VM123_07700 [archaeon]|nr:hypothetical protein [archaeon]